LLELTVVTACCYIKAIEFRIDAGDCQPAVLDWHAAILLFDEIRHDEAARVRGPANLSQGCCNPRFSERVLFLQQTRAHRRETIE
jgi:hypothetical protein